ncbi:hypothetical protein [Rhodocyclus purpureus]|uniref:hypothetical protein n=1 Tax=Rhodocyclus purpureus TaxID=1067 RepID=UPI0019144C89|nr:hypothetical protein [Rhodocyclus purpureus]MBK5912942.1 hypothetical protein [Rhodocyclus purpureus]
MRSYPTEFRGKQWLREFPVAEGFGIFIGVVAWELLVEGRIDFAKGLTIAIPITLASFAFRCWRARRREQAKR